MPDRLQQRLVEIGAPADVRALAADLAEQAVRDSLTGLYNRRFFDEALAQNIETARRYNRELSLILFDLDNFKTVNDTCGHLAGDEVLRTFTKLLQKTARKADIVCRVGGDEFAVILPETGLSKGRNFLNRFFQGLEKTGGIFPTLGTKSSKDWKLSASAGAAALPAENLFAAADAELLAAKQRISLQE
ncbi:MAG: GGDEF domain-containing protein [Kiritimatiellales bacterium]